MERVSYLCVSIGKTHKWNVNGMDTWTETGPGDNRSGVGNLVEDTRTQDNVRVCVYVAIW